MKFSDFTQDAQTMLVTGLRIKATWCVMQEQVPLAFCQDRSYLTFEGSARGLRCVRLETIEGLAEAARRVGEHLEYERAAKLAA